MDQAAARELGDAMVALSQYYFSAGWLDELEFFLWNRIMGNPMAISYFDELSREQITHLQGLSHACGGWMRWPSEAENDARPEDDKLWEEDAKLWEAVWCPLAEWIDRFKVWSMAWKARQEAAKISLVASTRLRPTPPPVSAGPTAAPATMPAMTTTPDDQPPKETTPPPDTKPKETTPEPETKAPPSDD